MDTLAELNQARPQRLGLNLFRGIGFALLCGASGFFAPMIFGLSFTACRWWILGVNNFDRAYDLNLLTIYLAPPAIGTAIIFAASGWATFAPRGTFRFVRTLVTIAVISLPSWIVLALLLESLGLTAHRFKGDSRPLVEPLPVLLFAIPPTVTALILSVMRSLRGSAVRTPESSCPVLGDNTAKIGTSPAGAGYNAVNAEPCRFREKPR
jgi:hypothetical protein